jgi:hypothetical protein
MVVLGGALLWGACSKEPAPKEAPAAQPAKDSQPAGKPAGTPEDPAEAPSEESQAAAPAVEEAPPEFKIGQSRDEVMKLFAKCGERKAFMPPGPKTLYVEIFQPKNTEECKKRLGERRFTIRGGELVQITPGMIPPPPPPSKRTSSESM